MTLLAILLASTSVAAIVIVQVLSEIMFTKLRKKHSTIYADVGSPSLFSGDPRRLLIAERILFNLITQKTAIMPQLDKRLAGWIRNFLLLFLLLVGGVVAVAIGLAL